MSLDTIARGLAAKAIAFLTGASPISSNPGLSFTSGAYNQFGQINLDDNGSIKIGTGSNTSGASFILAKVLAPTSNLHGYADTSIYTPTVPGLGFASVNAAPVLNSANVAEDHINAVQARPAVNLGGAHLSQMNSMTTGGDANNTIVDAYNALSIADLVLTGGATCTNAIGLAIAAITSGSFNWGLRQFGTAQNAFGGKVGFGIVIPVADVHLAATGYVGWGPGFGADPTAKLSQPSTGVMATNAPTILGNPMTSGAGTLATPYTVATLPTAAAALKGAHTYVTDATSLTTALVGGGLLTRPVFCSFDGTTYSWKGFVLA